jgi:hypothetical protein
VGGRESGCAHQRATMRGCSGVMSSAPKEGRAAALQGSDSSGPASPSLHPGCTLGPSRARLLRMRTCCVQGPRPVPVTARVPTPRDAHAGGHAIEAPLQAAQHTRGAARVSACELTCRRALPPLLPGQGKAVGFCTQQKSTAQGRHGCKSAAAWHRVGMAARARQRVSWHAGACKAEPTQEAHKPSPAEWEGRSRHAAAHTAVVAVAAAGGGGRLRRPARLL